MAKKFTFAYENLIYTVPDSSVSSSLPFTIKIFKVYVWGKISEFLYIYPFSNVASTEQNC